MQIVRGENIYTDVEKLHRIIWSVLRAWITPGSTDHCVLFHTCQICHHEEHYDDPR